VATGGCTLTMTVSGFDGEITSDDMYLNIVPFVNAGEDAAVTPGDSFQLEAVGTETGTIEWTTSGDGTFSDANIMQPIYTPGAQDIANAQVTLSVEVAIIEPCDDSDDDSMVLDIIVGVDEIEKTNTLSIYPNPTNDVFTLNIDGLTAGEDFTYFVYTSYGKEVYRQVANAKSTSYERVIDMTDFVAGIYFVSVKSEKGTTTMKVVKK